MVGELGGGHKINLVKKELEEYKDRDDLILLFTDSYNTLLLADKKTILDKFKSFQGARVVFTAERSCWPDQQLADQYPNVSFLKKRFLNSGGFMGYAKEIYQLFHHAPVANTGNDQLYYTNIFLDVEARKKYGIQLDTTSRIFHYLNGATGETICGRKLDM